MSDLGQKVSYEIFSQWVRNALDNLYDTYTIQRNPLIDLFGQGQMTRLQKAQSLRKVLLQSIQSLGGTHQPDSAPDWQAYRILEMRFLDSLSVDEVALELSISKSQFFREQARAVSLLIDIVWDRYQESRISLPQPASEPDIAQVEADRLSSQSVNEVVDLVQLVEELVPTLDVLGQPGGLRVSVQAEGAILYASSNRVMLRQIILILCGWSASRFVNGMINIKMFHNNNVMSLALSIFGEPIESKSAEIHSIEIAKELATRLGIELTFSEGSGTWKASLEWSTIRSRVLVIDDDAGIPMLFRRYLTGYPWEVFGAANGVEARRLIETIRPSVITLDVMMPQEDGWDLLSVIKSDPSMKEIPVIVCSVLMSPELATHLGAEAYLPKPVSQQDLIEALARWGQVNPLLGKNLE